MIAAPPVLTIPGAGAGLTIIDGADAGSVLVVESRRLTLSGVTLQNGTAAQGGGINVESRVQLDVADSEIVGNEGTFRGGGIFAAVRSRLLLTNVVIEGNVGAGIFLDTDPDGTNGPKGVGSNLTMTGGALRDNAAGVYPALDARVGMSTVEVSGVSVHDNVATFDEGGSIGSGGNLTIRGSQVFDNTQAGGIDASGTLTIVDSTIRDNVGDIGGIASAAPTRGSAASSSCSTARSAETRRPRSASQAASTCSTSPRPSIRRPSRGTRRTTPAASRSRARASA